MVCQALQNPNHPFPIAIGLGSNLGDRRRTLELACALLERGGVRIARRSRLYWTRPWGVTDQPEFMNAAVALRADCGLRPLELLARCRWIENQLGRRREARWGPRRIDLDLLVYGEMKLERPDLTLPHPRIAERDFVLAPLIDLGIKTIAAVDPRGMRALLADLKESERTIIQSEPWK